MIKEAQSVFAEIRSGYAVREREESPRPTYLIIWTYESRAKLGVACLRHSTPLAGCFRVVQIRAQVRRKAEDPSVEFMR